MSSRVDRDFQWTTALLTMLAIVPIVMLAATLTYPAAGVIATSPTTAPTHAPTADAFLPRITSNAIHASAAAADAVFVVANASAA